MSAVRVALDTHSLFDGHGAARTYFRELLPELIDLAHAEDEFVIFHSGHPDQLTWLAREQRSTIARAPFASPRRDRAWRWARTPPVEMVRRRISGRPWVADACHSFTPPLMPTRATRKVLSIHSFDRLSSSLKRSLRVADAIVVPSRSLKMQLLQAEEALGGRSEPVLEERLVVLHPGVNRRYVEPPKASEVEDLFVSHPFLEQDYLLVQGGASTVAGGLETLLDAYRNGLAATDLPPLVVLLSDAEASQSLVRAVRERGLDGKVFMLENLEREFLPALYRGAEFLLYPGLSGSFGTAVLEAAAAGVPSIVGPDCGVLEVVWRGLLVPPAFEPSHWGEAIARLHTSSEERAERAAQVRTEAVKSDWSSVAQAHWELYGAG